MKKIAIALAGLSLIMSCTSDKQEGGLYIGPSQIEITDGVMTPETLLALGRLSDPQLSPDGSIRVGGSAAIVAEGNLCLK